MKIAMVNNLYTPHMIGGAELFMQGLAEDLQRNGMEVHVATLGKQIRSDVVNGVPVRYIQLENIHWPFGESHGGLQKLLWHVRDIRNSLMGQQLGRFLDEVSPDVVHTGNLSGFSVTAWNEAGKRGIPIVHTVHDFHLLCIRSSMFRSGRPCTSQCLLCGLFSWAKHGPMRFVTRAVGVSDYIIRTHREYGWFRDIPTTHIYNSCEFADNSQNERKDVPVVLGFMGRLSPAKGVDFILESYLKSPLAQTTELLIAGKGDEAYTGKIRKRIAGSKARLIGHVTPQQLYQQIDLLVVPSLGGEAFGRVIIEANAHGIPVLATNRGAIPEIVEEGLTGYIIDPNDTEALSLALVSLVARGSSLRQMAPACRSKAREFRPEVIRRQYEELYATSANSRPTKYAL